MSADVGNAIFEAGGAALMWKSFAALRRDRQICGVYWPAWAFYAAWGAWNLYYYPSLRQWWSLAAGAVLVVGNVAWVVLAARIQWAARHPRRAPPFLACTCPDADPEWGAGSAFHDPARVLDPRCPRHGSAA